MHTTPLLGAQTYLKHPKTCAYSKMDPSSVHAEFGNSCFANRAGARTQGQSRHSAIHEPRGATSPLNCPLAVRRSGHIDR